MILQTNYKMKPPPSAKPIKSILKKLGCVGLWAMNENGGLFIFDLSGNGYHLAAGIGPTWVAGKFGSATHYVAASNQYFVRDCSPVTSMPYTIVCWVKAGEDNPTAVRNWFFYGQSDDSADYFSLDFQTDGRIKAWDRATGGEVYSIGDFADGKWHQVVVTVEFTTEPLLTIYIDGVYNNQFLHGSADETSTYNRIAVGMLRDLTPGNAFEGDIDNVSMYNRIPAVGEIAQLYQEPFYMFGRKLNPFLSAAAPPEVACQFASLTTSLWWLKHNKGLYTEL